MSKIPENYGGLSPEHSSYENSVAAILPVPFDMTSSYQIGSDRGPKAILDASGHVELYDIETKSEVYKRGIFTAAPVIAKTSKEMIDLTYRETKKLLGDDKFVITLGGEHAISPAPIRAHAEKFGNISILQFDAHTDLRDSYEDDKLSHASAMARALEIPGVERLVSVGIRAIDVCELPAIKPENTFFAEDIYEGTAWIPKVVERLGPKVYISFDLDVFDPSVLPATGTPEPGGLHWYQCLALLKAVALKREIVGSDVVELMPLEGEASSDFLAAKLVYKILTYKFELASNI